MQWDILIDAVRRKKNTFFWGLLAILFGIGIYNYYQEFENLEIALSYIDEPVLHCNLESGFYDKDIKINLYTDLLLAKDAVILYTLNGDDPKEYGDIFEKKIKIQATDEVEVVSLQAVVLYKGEFSEVIYRNYFIGKDIYNRYTYPIVSISTANENLFDYEKGIFVTGITYQNYLDNGGDPDADLSQVTCNFNRRGDEWLRDSYLEVFDANGVKISSQGVGIGVTGASSSGYEVKSLKLIANEQYDENNTKFEGEFWRNYASSLSLQSHNYTFNKILLKSGGQDFYETQMRWDIISELAEEAGLYPITGAQKVIVYLNGEYYSIMTMTEDYSSYNIAKACGLDKDYIEKLERTAKYEIGGFEQAGITDLFLVDLNNENNRNELERVVDMEQFLLYYAIQVIINNVDWPQSNYGMWRYTGNSIEENEYSDGKYRFYLFDVDLAYLPDSHWRKEVFGDELFDKLMDSGSEIFENVLESEYYKTKFINLVCSLCNTVFSEENIGQKIDKFIEGYQAEIVYLESNEYNNGDNWIDSYQGLWRERVEEVKNVMLHRADEMYDMIEAYWQDFEQYTLEIEAVEHARIYCDTTYICNDNFTGKYYKNSSLTLSAEIAEGFLFDHWLVNGEMIYEEEVTITENMIQDVHCIVSLVLTKDISKGLVINEIYAKGGFDWIELYNVSNETISLADYYLTDNFSNLEKYSCPDIQVESEGIVVINGKYNNELGAYLCNFNLSSGETLYLVEKETGEIVDQVIVPEMSEGESYGRNLCSDKWFYFTEPTKGLVNN